MSDESPFHSGERTIQSRLGVRDRIDSVGKRFIRKYMPDQHRTFFEQLSTFFVGSIDGEGRPWASVLVGEPGFVRSPTKRALLISGKPIPGDQLASNLSIGARLGCLGLEFHTRRRNRMNGTVRRLSPDEIGIAVDQSFGNCPKYINTRSLLPIEDARETGSVSETTELTKATRAILSQADTLFIATTRNGDGPAYRYGVDVSHRGGLSGFIKILGDGTIWVPDYTGNEFYNTLGNIQEEGRAGLLAFDFLTGDFVQITGDAHIDWNVPAAIDDPRALRGIVITPRQLRYLPAAFPFEAPLDEHSPFLLGEPQTDP